MADTMLVIRLVSKGHWIVGEVTCAHGVFQQLQSFCPGRFLFTDWKLLDADFLGLMVCYDMTLLWSHRCCLYHQKKENQSTKFPSWEKCPIYAIFFSMLWS